MRLYQRLVALDREKAIEVVETALKQQPRVEVFDQILVPALVRAERDMARTELDETGQDFVWRTVGEILDRLDEMPADDEAIAPSSLTDRKAGFNGAVPASTTVHIVGLAVQEKADALVLRMLGQLLSPAGYSMEIITDTESSLQVTDRVFEQSPNLVVVSLLGREGLTFGRYLLRRLRARFADMPIVAALWGQTDDSAPDAARSPRSVPRALP